jgi:alkanesulfonate monooxygenase SsuD/methylene tetrahydromethanopterin reductase-like flavin-dependent oxidoreductase (luciferase family)
MRLSTVILPIERWATSREKWRRAEELGFYAAYTYDHLSWQRLVDRPWFGALPTLTAAGLETSTIRLGTMVTSPNFRHPVPLAKELLSLDDITNGRLVVGLGSGGVGADASVLGNPVWSLKQRTDRFADFTRLLDELLRQAETTHRGTYYSALEARMLPGMIQQPRPPLLIAAEGKRGMQLAAELGDGWITLGRPREEGQDANDVVRIQVSQLSENLEKLKRDPTNFNKVLLSGLHNVPRLSTVEEFVDWASGYKELGIDELILHWPEPNSPYEADVSAFEEIALATRGQL